MIKIRYLLEKIYLPKDKWVTVTDKKEIANIKDQLFTMIQTAYGSMGGHLKFKYPSDIMDPELAIWYMIDLDDDNDPDAVLFGKRSHGIKFTGVGHDGSPEAKKEIMRHHMASLKKGGHWIEVSHRVADLLLLRQTVPYVSDPAKVKRLMPDKDIRWLGEHPTEKKYKGINGWYERTIGGTKQIKIIVGIPR